MLASLFLFLDLLLLLITAVHIAIIIIIIVSLVTFGNSHQFVFSLFLYLIFYCKKIL